MNVHLSALLAAVLCGCHGLPGMWPGNLDDWSPPGEDTGREAQDTGSGAPTDADGDGYDSTASGGDDCDDEDSAVHPGASETWYDGVDSDCDGASDYDADGDGYDSDEYDGEDCDDGNASIHPAATETWYDGVDQDCDGASDYDADGDGYDGEDCDDTDSSAYPGTVTDHEGISMTCIGPGTFTMGSPTSEVGRDTDENRHEVTLTSGFYIGVYEVTRSQFEGFMGYQSWGYSGCSNCAAEYLDWHVCAAFANAVSDAAGLDRCYDCTSWDSGSEEFTGSCELDGSYSSPYECEGYRLPTEAEWEYAARAGTTSAFSNGGNLVSVDDVDDCSWNIELDNGEELEEIAWYCGNSDETQTVGQLEPNRWGLYDVHGNVWEWCHDWYDSEYGGDAIDPWGEETGTQRVERGGSWGTGPGRVRAADRHGYHPDTSDVNYGCRIAREAP